MFDLINIDGSVVAVIIPVIIIVLLFAYATSLCPNCARYLGFMGARRKRPSWCESGLMVSIPASRFGSVLVKAEGQTHEFPATADRDVPAGRTVTITGIAGNGVIVRDDTASTASAATTGEG